MFYEVVLDCGETANKCTISPLASRADFRLIYAKTSPLFGPFQAEILLHHQGECLTTLKNKITAPIAGISCIDCIWRRLDHLLDRVAQPLPHLARIPEGFITAYPRKSKVCPDPENGLATIEAIFVAAALLGHWDLTLFSKYYFGKKFIELNRERFLALGVHQAADPLDEMKPAFRVRNSQQRRNDRGKCR
jgi:pre-rRNA-processing protein TSR3